MTRIAIFQATTGIDPAANAADLVDAVKQAAEGGAAMLFTPEMSGLLDQNRKRAAQHIVREGDNPVLAAVREAAATHGLWVALGSLAVAGDGDRSANRSFVIDSSGDIAARYDKMHMFDVELSEIVDVIDRDSIPSIDDPEFAPAAEETRIPGNEPVVALDHGGL